MTRDMRYDRRRTGPRFTTMQVVFLTMIALNGLMFWFHGDPRDIIELAPLETDSNALPRESSVIDDESQATGSSEASEARILETEKLEQVYEQLELQAIALENLQREVTEQHAQLIAASGQRAKLVDYVAIVTLILEFLVVLLTLVCSIFVFQEHKRKRAVEDQERDPQVPASTSASLSGS